MKQAYENKRLIKHVEQGAEYKKLFTEGCNALEGIKKKIDQ